MILKCENCQTMYMFTESQLKAQDYKFVCKKCNHENRVSLPSDFITKEAPKGVQDLDSPERVIPEQPLYEDIFQDLPMDEQKKEVEPLKPENPIQEEEPKADDIFTSPVTIDDGDKKMPEDDGKQPGQSAYASVKPVQKEPEVTEKNQEDVIEGFEEFTMDDLNESVGSIETKEEPEKPVDSLSEETDTGWLESTKIQDETPKPNVKDGITAEVIPESLSIEERHEEPEAEKISQTPDGTLLNEESILIPEVDNSPVVKKDVLPLKKPFVLRAITFTGIGILLVIALIAGIYYYLVEYTPSNPDLSKLTLMTYSVFPVSESKKDKAAELVKSADELYLKDTTNDYDKSLSLYKKAVIMDHHLVDGYIGIAKDYALLAYDHKDRNGLKNINRFLQRLKVMTHSSSDYYLVSGMEDLAENDINRAKLEFITALKQSPQFPEALYYEGFVDFLQGKPLSDTASLVTEAVKLKPYMTQAQLLLAKIYYKQGNISEANDILEHTLQDSPYNVKANILFTKIESITVTDTSSLISQLDNILNKGAGELTRYDQSKIYYTIGKLFSKNNNAALAIDAFNKSIGMEPSYGAFIAIGDVYVTNKELDKAEQAYSKAASMDDKLPEAYFRLGKAYYDDNKYVYAIENYKKGLGIQGNNPYMLYELSLARYKNGEIKNALDKIDEAIKISSDNPEFITLKGKLLADSGDYKGAYDLLSDAVQKFPGYAPLHTEYSIVLDRNGNYNDALNQITIAIKLSPNSYNSYPYMAYTLNKLSRYKDAEKYALSAINRMKDDAFAYKVLGEIYFNEGKWNDAINSYKESIKSQPYDSDVFYKLAQVYSVGKTFTEAIQSLENAIKLNPANALYHYMLGNVYKDMGDIQLAIGEYGKSLDIDSTMAEAYYERGEMNILGRNDLAAVSDLKNAIKYAPKESKYLVALADYYYHNKETYAAIDYLKSALKIAPQDPEVHYKLGIVYNYVGDINSAKKQFMKALDLSYNNPKPMVGLGNAYYQNGDNKRAIQFYLRAIRIDPHYGDAYEAIGALYQSEGQYDKAITAYREAAEFMSKPADAYFKLGMLLANVGDNSGAKNALKKAIKLGLPDGLENQAEKKLSELI